MAILFTPVLSGSASADGLATTTSNYSTLKTTLTSGNPLIGASMSSITIYWLGQTSTPASGTWQVKHYNSAGAQQGSTTSTTATPPASSSGTHIAQTFSVSDGVDILENDYFTLSCLETNDNNRSVTIQTYPTCSSSCQYSNHVLSDGYSINNVKGTWQSGGSTERATLLPPPPLIARF